MQELCTRLTFRLPAYCLLLAVTSGAYAQQWKTYRYPADGFSASYPAEPQMQKRDVPTQSGTFQLRSYLTQAEPAAYFVSVCDYGQAADGADPTAELQGAKNGTLTNSNSRLLREKKIVLGIYPGVEFESASESAHFYVRIYMVGTTLYETLAVSPPQQRSLEALRFLDSFQLIARDPS